jgi:hypothetical protein
MDTRQINQVLMFARVEDYCETPEHQTIIRSFEGLEEDYDQFRALMSPLREESGVALSLTSSGVSEDKAQVRERMADRAAKVSAALLNVAGKIGDQVLASNARLSKSDVLNGREIEAAAKVDALLKLAVPHGPALAKYAVTEAVVNELDALAERFSKAIGRPRAVILERKRANQNLPQLIAQATESLVRIDRTLTVLEETHKDFVRGYRNSRRIVNTAATRSLSDEELANAEQRQAAAAESRAQKAANKLQRDAEAAQKREERKARLLSLKEEVRPASRTTTPAAESDAQPGATRTTDHSANGSSAIAG